MKLMKQEKNIETTATSQFQQSIKVRLARRGDCELQESSNFRVSHLPEGRPVPAPSEGGKGGGFGKGPPGRSRSPGARGDPDHPPDGGACPPVPIIPDRVSHPVRDGTKTEPFSVLFTSLTARQGHPLKAKFTLRHRSLSFGYQSLSKMSKGHTEYQRFITNQILIFYKHLNFFIMKKQILILAFLLVAVFAGVTNSYGQAVAGSAPQPITCVTDAFHPRAGVPYDYSATVSPALGSAYWFATTATTFIGAGGVLTANREASGGSVVATATNYMDAVVGDATPSLTNITWTTAGLAAAKVAITDPAKLFVVLNYDAPATGCANNLKVYPIRPVNAFTIDIKNMTQAAIPVPVAAYGDLVEACFPPIESAVYVPGVEGSINYDFGVNTLYFEVIAANFTGSFTPSFKLGGLVGTTQTADIDYGVTVGTYGVPVTALSSNGIYPGSAVTTTVSNTSAGVSIYVRVTVHNNNEEGLALTPITLAVEAVNSATVPEADVNNADCTIIAAYTADDTATQNLKARPTVGAVAPGLFIPVQP